MREGYDPDKPSAFIICLVSNNLYGWAMSKPLPTVAFKWMDEEKIENWKNLTGDNGCIL